MATVIVQQPDGVPYIGIDKDNPYKNAEHELTMGQEPHPVYFGDTMHFVSPVILIRASELDKIRDIIKFVTVFDGMMSLISYAFTMYPAYIIIGLINLVGYRGALRYNQIRLWIYATFQILNSVSKFLYIAHNPSVDSGIILGVSGVFNMWIVYITNRMTRLIPHIRN